MNKYVYGCKTADTTVSKLSFEALKKRIVYNSPSHFINRISAHFVLTGEKNEELQITKTFYDSKLTMK